MQLGKLTKDDARTICGWRYPPPYDVYDHPPFEQALAERWAIALDGARTEQFRAVRDGGRLIGFSRLFPRDGRWLLGVGMEPSVMGRGGGAAFMTAVLDDVRSRIAVPVELEVRAFNQRALRCYRSVGCEVVGSRLVDLRDGPIEMVVMRTPSDDRPRDIGFDEDGRWFRHRAAGIIVRDGCVLMARNSRDPYFYSIGGGVHHGESAVDAARREVFEESGAWLQVDRLAFVHENFFTDSIALPGRTCHELTMYFLMVDDPSLDLATGGSTTQDGVDEWLEWVPLAQYGVDRPAHPSFFATELADLGPAPRLITTRE